MLFCFFSRNQPNHPVMESSSSSKGHAPETVPEDPEAGLIEDMEEERRNFFKIIAAFKYYR